MSRDLPKVSVIIPVYNAANYLNHCLDSIINQTYKNYEIIIVNDGSTDRSLEICNKYAATYSKITVINQANAGVSKARNVGLDYATGQYTCFVDADDWVEHDMLSGLVDQITWSQSDLILCNFISELPNKTELIPSPFPHQTILTKEMIKEQLILGLIERNNNEKIHSLLTFRGPWGKLYNLNLIKKNRLTFDETLHIGEDFLFNLNYLIHCDQVMLIENGYYHYVLNPQSATAKYKEDCWETIYLLTLERLEQFLESYDLMQKASERFSKLVLKYYMMSLNNEFRPENKKGARKKRETISTMCHHPYVQSSVKIVNHSNKSSIEVPPYILLFTKYKLSYGIYLTLNLKRFLIKIIKRILNIV